MFEDLSGKIVIVTGGSQGQGAAEARLFAEAGAKVIIADVADESGQTVAAEIGASYCHTDVSIAADWRDLMTKVVDAHGRLHVLVNNAAVHWTRSIDEESVEDFDRLIGDQPPRNVPRHQGCYRPDACFGRGLHHQHRVDRRDPRPAAPWLLRRVEMGDSWPDEDGRHRAWGRAESG